VRFEDQRIEVERIRPPQLFLVELVGERDSAAIFEAREPRFSILRFNQPRLHAIDHAEIPEIIQRHRPAFAGSASERVFKDSASILIQGIDGEVGIDAKMNPMLPEHLAAEALKCCDIRPLFEPGTKPATRSFISSAALLVKVSARIRKFLSRAPSSKRAMRQVRTWVLPEPGPARTSNAPSFQLTACRWISVSLASAVSRGLSVI
jgi:hypothetical protein